MPDVRIFRPAKTAMQSGYGNTRQWLMVFEPSAAKRIDPLMGWVGSADTRGQVRLRFDSFAEAEAFAKKNGLSYRAQEPKSRRIKPKSYADNFRWERP